MTHNRLNQIFELFKKEGINSQFSTGGDKIYVSATRESDLTKIGSIISKYGVRLSFVDTANANIVFEYKPIQSFKRLNKESMLLSVSPDLPVLQVERELNQEGFSIGYYYPPLLKDKDMTFLDWLEDYHIPSLNYFSGDLSFNIRGLSGILTNGEIYNSITAPRMATGSDINRLLLLAGRNLFYPTLITLKVNHTKPDVNILSFSAQRIKYLFCALASIATKGIKIEFATLYTRDDGTFEPVLEIGYSNSHFDFKNWIIRTVTNEGASLINPVSTYQQIQERLYRLIQQPYQVELMAKFRGIGGLEDLLQMLSQNFKVNGYLYRYEKTALSFRLILPEISYEKTKDMLSIECKKYRGDIKLIDRKQQGRDEIPLHIYSRIIHSCS